LIVLTIIEEAVVGLFHGRSIAASLGDLFGTRLAETLASYLIMLLVLISRSFGLLGGGRTAKTDVILSLIVLRTRLDHGPCPGLGRMIQLRLHLKA
jgi:hypothetical protein